MQTSQPNEFSYDIALYKKRIVENIANFCCSDIAIFKSPLCFDVTFDLGKSPPYFALVLTYQNTSLISKQTKKSPTMLRPILQYCYVIRKMKIEFTFYVSQFFKVVQD